MATVSTIPTVWARLVTLMESNVPSGVDVSYTWSGNETEPEAAFLGHHPEFRDILTRDDQVIPTIKAGRKERREDYEVPLTVWVFRPDLSADDAKTCHERAFAIFAEIEDFLADDPALGLSPSIHWCRIASYDDLLIPFQSGWACLLTVTLTVLATLN